MGDVRMGVATNFVWLSLLLYRVLVKEWGLVFDGFGAVGCWNYS